MRMSRAWIGSRRVLCAGPLAAQTTAATPHAVSLLRTNCSPCHSQQNRSSGLSMDSRAEFLQGGNRGPAVKPGAAGREPAGAGDRAEGRSENAARPAAGRGTDLDHPRLDRAGNDLARAGAGIKRGRAPTTGRFSRRKPCRRRPSRPPDGAGNPIDRFVMAKLEKEGIRPSPEADRDTLLRRVSLDLTGLPPSPREIQDFRADRVAGCVREGGGPAAGLAALRRTLGHGTGWTWRAMPIPTATLSMSRARSGNTATG